MSTKLAAQMYTLREYTQTPEAIDSTLARVKEIGYDAVQMSAWGPIDPKELRALTDKHGLEICATHVSYDAIVNHTQETIENHRIWGTQYVGLGSMPNEFRNTEDGIRAFAKAIRPAGEAIAKAGQHLIYHNHNFELARFDDKTGLDILMEETDPSWFQFEIDTHWITAGGGDPAVWIHKVAGRMDIVHFKDMVYVPEEGRATFAEIGQGNLNWPAIISACADIGVQMHIIEQDTCRRCPFESLRMSLEYLHSMGLK